MAETDSMPPAVADSPLERDSKLRRSGRDRADVETALSGWLAAVLGHDCAVAVTVDGGVDSNGMSSETVPFTAVWDEGGNRITRRYVARVTPRPEDVPVFPSYRLDHQFRVMQLARELTAVPVPAVHWYEGDASVLGTPFFVMDRIEGRIPPDVMPYTMGANWFYDATPAAQRALQDHTVDVLAALHAIPDATHIFAFLNDGTPDDALTQRFRWMRDWYDFSAADLTRSPLIDRCVQWLQDNWPDPRSLSEPVLLWGDARIGNVIYHDMTPAAVLDWEMATLGPRELDVAWLIFAHQFFQETALLAGMPGLPDTFCEKDIRQRYRERTGVELGDLRWFYVFSGVVWCCALMRTGARRVHFGEMAMPDDIEAFFYHAPALRRLIDGEPLR